jgi:hypothetical protein
MMIGKKGLKTIFLSALSEALSVSLSFELGEKDLLLPPPDLDPIVLCLLPLAPLAAEGRAKILAKC